MLTFSNADTEIDLDEESRQRKLDIIASKKKIIDNLINYYNEHKIDLNEEAYLELKEVTAFCIFGHYNHIDNYYIQLNMQDTNEAINIQKATKKALKVFTSTQDLNREKYKKKEFKYYEFEEFGFVRIKKRKIGF